MPRRRSTEQSGSVDLSVQGAEDFLALSKALKAAGRTQLRKDLNKSMRDAAKPLLAVAKRAAREKLPSRGGAGDFFAGKKSRVTVKTGRDPGVSVAILKQDPRIDTQGRLTHPVFGRPRSTVVQRVPTGIFSDALTEAAPEVRDQLIAAIDNMADRIVRELGGA